MEYSINVVLTDKDYDEFDEFTMKHVPETKRMIRVARWSFVAVVAVAASFPLFAGNFAASAWINVIPHALILLVYQLLMIPTVRVVSKQQRKKLQKAGGALYAPSSVMKFFDDHFCEITAESKTDHTYAAVKAVSVVGAEKAYIHLNGMLAYIVPASAFASPLEFVQWLAFIKTKCTSVTQY